MQRHFPDVSPRNPQGHGRVAFFPYGSIQLKALRPKAFSEHPKTFGEHLKKCRLIRGLRQRDVATMIGVDPFTVLNWEKDRTEPPIGAWPAILGFLGYDPYPQPTTLSERMYTKRRVMGWTLKEAARRLGVDEGTWGQWERGQEPPWKRYRDALTEFLST